MLEDLKDKKILILGVGEEGIDSYLALRKLFPDKVLGMADQKEFPISNFQFLKLLKKDKNIKLHLGEGYLKAIGEYDVIIKTPGIPANILKPFLKEGSLVTTQTEIFLANFPGKVIGVTGTKGKGTTSALIYSILKTAGFKVKLVGNIGQPVFQLLLKAKPNEIFVYELSSHQLQNLNASPFIAVFLNLFSDHLDYYLNFKEYQKAKINIVKYQTKDDYLIFNAKDKLVLEISKKTKAHKIDFTQDKKYYKTILSGEFNQLNIQAAVRVAEIFQVKPEIIKTAVKNFKGLPHRLEFVGKFKGIEFYDNSMATIPQTTILDLETFNGQPISLIVGGSEKGSDYTSLAKKILETSVKNLIILGQGTGQKIEKLCHSESADEESLRSFASLRMTGGSTQDDRGMDSLLFFQVKTMEEAVRVCYEQTPKNGVCLLSPASASFNLFKDYKDRGEQFKNYAKKFATAK